MGDKTEYSFDHAIAEGMETLLGDAIRKYPILYDKAHKHRFQSLYPEQHERAWNRISNELNLELENCKSLWSCIKQKYIKHRKRLDKGEPVSQWPTYDLLHKWLDKHVKRRRTRQDFIKQITMPRKFGKRNGGNRDLTSPVAAVDDDDDDDDDGDGGDEEWTELMEDKNTMVKIHLKRKNSHDDKTLKNGDENLTKESKKKFKIEILSEQGTDFYNDNYVFPDTDAQSKDAEEIVVLEKINSDTPPEIEVIEVKESVDKENSTIKKLTSSNLERHLGKLEEVITKCANLFDRSVQDKLISDSNEVFGKYIASLVRELPHEKQMKIRLNILQYTSELISKQISK